MICPVCAITLESGVRRCHSCGTELTEYLMVCCQADVLYNDALIRMRRGRYSHAAELLCRASGLRPSDVDILSLWAEAALLGGNPGEAVRILEGALELDGGEPIRTQHRRALAALEEATSADILIRKALSEETARLEQAAYRLEMALQRLESANVGELRP